MTRQQIYKEMEEMLGLVPGFFKLIPERSLEFEWESFKKLQLEQSSIPNKYRELIGLGIAAATKCQYCTLYHTEVAKLFGATEEEIEDAVHTAKSSAGWSTYLNGMQIDMEQFKKELKQISKHVESHMKVPV